MRRALVYFSPAHGIVALVPIAMAINTTVHFRAGNAIVARRAIRGIGDVASGGASSLRVHAHNEDPAEVAVAGSVGRTNEGDIGIEGHSKPDIMALGNKLRSSGDVVQVGDPIEFAAAWQRALVQTGEKAIIERGLVSVSSDNEIFAVYGAAHHLGVHE